MNELIQFFAEITTTKRTSMIIFGLLLFLFLESGLPLFKMKYKKFSNLDLIFNNATYMDKFGNRTFIYTELLEIDPINETLKTDRRVNYESNNIHHSSVGMFANLNEDEIRFEKNVRGFYEKIIN